MRAIWLKRIIGAIVLGSIVAGLVRFGWPGPVAVDLATVTKGPMEGTGDDEAKTNVRHIYTVSAPVAGKVLRMSRQPGDPGVSHHVGDEVAAGETVVAVMQPTAPSFLDVRARGEIQSAVAAGAAALKRAA